MTDQYTETTTQSWGQRLKNAVAGVLFGLVLFIGAFPLLWWNEGRAVDRIKALDEGRRIVVEAPYANVDPNNNGKLVHISGGVTTDDVLKDSLFGVQEKALRLKRVVEVYQWKETSSTREETNMGGSQTSTTTYSYDKAWSPNLIDSGRFKHPEQHQNPASKKYSDQNLDAKMNFGPYVLSRSFVGQIDNFEQYQLLQDNYDAMPENLRQSFTLDGNYYISGDLANPQIGDVKIHFEIVRPTDISVIGKQNGNTIEPYSLQSSSVAANAAPSTSGIGGLLRSLDSSVQQSSQTIELLQVGIVGAEEMFAIAARNNSLLTWGLRLLGCFIMWLGMRMILAPLTVFASFVPFMGTLADAGIGIIFGLVSLALSLLTIAVAWMFYRPVIGGALVIGAVVCFSSIAKRIGNAKQPVS